ncbi:MAG: hypothetical protein KJT03_17185, partial [Verrucomicrobiae bacterium]|nr:hypothetical protein [Verrucomicrobiae bacterium]
MLRLFLPVTLVASLCASVLGQAPELENRTVQRLALSDVISLVLNRNLTLERSKVQMELRENDVFFEEADGQA